MPSPAKLSALALGGAVALAQLGACVEPPQRGDGSGDARAVATDSTSSTPNTAKRTATIPADGWNERIAWRGLDEGLREAKQAGMPVMLVVHTSWCGNCQKLKQTFNGDPNLERLSESFVMVHVDQDVHPEATLYGPDGQYIPRVMFLDQDGKVDQRLQNPNRPSRYRYFYTPQEDLVATMRKALDRHGKES
ncbi:MAG: thioredoxin family protein [Enhygromyxa sp.]